MERGQFLWESSRNIPCNLRPILPADDRDRRSSSFGCCRSRPNGSIHDLACLGKRRKKQLYDFISISKYTRETKRKEGKEGAIKL